MSTAFQEDDDLDEEAAKEAARRESILPKVPRKLLKRYDMIRQKRLGIGLVLAVEGNCQGCNMRLPPQLFNILQRGDTVEQCPSCQRIVLWEGLLPDDVRAAAGGEAVTEAAS